ncbi:hypothetical protein SAMN02910317_01283 [Ruminococcaceae bacterium FB2012]|nr:hypothetical protein SAMN02910317_01283 [Ruminococcaceae bacterium FB2012]
MSMETETTELKDLNSMDEERAEIYRLSEQLEIAANKKLADIARLHQKFYSPEKGIYEISFENAMDIVEGMDFVRCVLIDQNKGKTHYSEMSLSYQISGETKTITASPVKIVKAEESNSGYMNELDTLLESYNCFAEFGLCAKYYSALTEDLYRYIDGSGVGDSHLTEAEQRYYMEMF